VDRADNYATNTVKHFKFESRGTIRPVTRGSDLLDLVAPMRVRPEWCKPPKPEALASDSQKAHAPDYPLLAIGSPPLMRFVWQS